MQTSSLNSRRTKIVCTLGPSTETHDQILALAKAGMNVARFNFSHGTQEDHKRRFEIVRQVSEEIKKPIAILQDLQGPKIRVQQFENDEVCLEKDQSFVLTTRDVMGNQNQVSVSYQNLPQDVQVGDHILLDDGNLKLRVEKINQTDVHCRVVFGGILKNRKGLNLPGSILSVSALTEKDRDDLQFGLGLGVDYVALSFVQRPDDINQIKDLIRSFGKNTPVIAKIEKPQAVKCIEGIIESSDGIMIARGDLGVEMDVEEVPPIQKEIISLCNERGVPVITATQMLESMMHHPRPTRAEAADVANAVLDGSDAVMLSGETAAGLFPIRAAETMSKIVSLIETKNDPRWDLKRRRPDKIYDPAYAIGYSASHAADLVNAKAIICMTQSGTTARMISRFRPLKPVVAITPYKTTLRRVALYWGVQGLLTPNLWEGKIEVVVQEVIQKLKYENIVSTGDKIVMTAGLPFTAKRTTNMLRIESI